MTVTGEESRPSRLGKTARLFVPLAITGVLLVVILNEGAVLNLLNIPADSTRARVTVIILETMFWVMVAYTLSRWVRQLFWMGYVQRRTGVPVPGLLMDLTAFVIYLVILIVVLNRVMDLPVSGLITTSSILIAVIGFALRYLISDVFTGIALGIEQPFRIGDWIELTTGIVGRVTSMNWRATRIVTKDDITVVIPNSRLATESFTNFSRPERYWRDSFEITLGYDITGWQAERLLLSAVWQVADTRKVPRKPEARIKEFLENGVRWEIRFWITDYDERERIRYSIKRNVLRNLHFSDVRVPGQHVEIRSLPKAQEKSDIDFLRGIGLFKALTADELGDIQSTMKRVLATKGTPVVRQGEEGASLFVVKEGMLDAIVTDANGRDTFVGQLAPGTFFGEMSLLTGAPRGATVTPTTDSICFEITKDALEPILHNRPELAEMLSDTLAERQLSTQRTMAATDRKSTDSAHISLADEFRRRIHQFFGL